MNRGEASDAILSSRATGPQKLILLEYLRRQDARADPMTAASWPGLAACTETAGCNEDAARQWRLLLIEAGVLVVVEARQGRTSAMRIDFGALATYRPPSKTGWSGKRMDRAAKASRLPPPESDPSRNPPVVKSASTGIRPLPESGGTPLPESGGTPLPESAPRSLLRELSLENSHQGAGGQAPLVEPTAPPLSPEIGRLIVLLQRWASEPAVKARWKVDLDADVRWFLARVVPAATRDRVDLLAELDAIDNWCEGKHRATSKPGWTAQGWKNGIARWLSKPGTKKLPSPDGTTQPQGDPAIVAWDRLQAAIPAQGPSCLRGAPAHIVATVDDLGGMAHLCRMTAFDLARLRPAFLAAFHRHHQEPTHARLALVEDPADRPAARDPRG